MKIIGSRKISIYQELFVLLLGGFLVAGFTFLALAMSGTSVLNHYFEDQTFIRNKNNQKMEKLQEYVLTNKILSNDSTELKKWLIANHVASMQVFKDNTLRFDSDYVIDTENEEYVVEDYYVWEAYYEISFTDGMARVFTTGVSFDAYYNYVILGSVILAFIAFFVVVLMGIQQRMKYIRLLRDEIEIMGAGELRHAITRRGKDELTELAEGLNELRTSFQKQLEQESYLTSSHKKLITEMSHDLRTPLTSLLIYTEILKQNKTSSKELQEKYIDKINRKANQIKKISDNLFEYSLITSKTEVQLEKPRHLQAVFYDLISEMISILESQKYSVVCELEWEEVYICVNRDYMVRIFDNITSNLTKYADWMKPVKIDTVNVGTYAGIRVANVITKEETKEQGTHIGLHNIKKMMEAMGGVCTVEESENDFAIEIKFGIHN